MGLTMPQLPKQLNATVAAEQQAIIDMQLAAQRSVKNRDFLRAVEQYAELIQLLSHFKHAQPTVLADAYRHYADANFSLANSLAKVNSEKAQLCQEQAVLQLQQALLHYPQEAKKAIKSCHQQLTAITKTVADKTHDQSLWVDIDMTEQSKKPVLHWRKTLLQRFMAVRTEAINEIALAAKESPAKTLLKI